MEEKTHRKLNKCLCVNVLLSMTCWIFFLFQVRSEFLVPRSPIIFPGGEQATVLGLRFEVKSLHFKKNEMRLRCTATLSEVTKMASEPLEAEIAEQQRSDLHVDFNAESGM